MQAISILDQADSITSEELLNGMGMNLCRCGTYHKIKAALLDAAESMGKLTAEKGDL